MYEYDPGSDVGKSKRGYILQGQGRIIQAASYCTHWFPGRGNIEHFRRAAYAEAKGCQRIRPAVGAADSRVR